MGLEFCADRTRQVIAVFLILLMCLFTSQGCRQNNNGTGAQDKNSTRDIDIVSYNNEKQDPLLSAWEWQNPHPQGNNINDIAAISEDVVWAVGDHGTIIKSVDGGGTWSLQESGTREDINFISAIDANTAWASGERGVALVTMDGGSSWTVNHVVPTDFQGPSINDDKGNFISTVDARVAWAVEKGKIFKTVDAGENWRGCTPDNNKNFSSVFSLDEDTVWVASYSGDLYRSDDGGTSWIVVTSPINYLDLSGPRIEALNKNNLWLIGYWSAYKTSDGGMTWSEQEVSLENSFEDICIVDRNTVWATTRVNKILRTMDGGVTWNSSMLEGAMPIGPSYSSYYPPISAANGLVAWAGGGSGRIYKTVNGGGDWIPCYTGIFTNFNDIDSLNNSAWVVGGDGAILKTNDGGSSWVPQESGTFQALYRVSVCDENNVWVVGDKGTILRTTDGGATWSPQVSGTQELLRGISCTDSNVAWVVSFSGTILRTTDGGNTWSPSYSDSKKHLLAVSAIDKNTAWVVGYEDLEASIYSGASLQFRGVHIGYG